jgi:macrolide transport system ATP-binding/permease protein
MLLSVSGISKSYGPLRVLNSVSFVLNGGERAGLVGPNGVGKTTLLRIILGQVEPDTGTATIPHGIEIGYLPQVISDFSGETIDDLIHESMGALRMLETRLRTLEKEMSQISDEGELQPILAEYTELSEKFERRGGYEIDYKIDMVLDGLELSYLPRSRRVATLSGGEKARVGLAELLLRSPELLLLDEPTNHLDFFALEWLEAYLQKQRAALLLVSHEREFLNRTVSSILEIAEHSREVKQYHGNYDAYIENKAIERKNWEEAYYSQREEIKHLKQVIQGKARQVGHNRPAPDRDKITHKFFGERVQKTISRNVSAAEEKLRRLQTSLIPEPPEEIQINPDFDPKALRGRFPLIASELHKSFGGRPVLEHISLTLRVDSRVVLLGPNGAGKSTLLKILAGLETPDQGSVSLAPTVSIGYLDQEQETLDPTKTAFQVCSEGLIRDKEELKAELLHYGLFTYEELIKSIGELSVGQKRKVQIARLIVQRANLMLLDEPTNHVSFDVLEQFERALMAFQGATIAVSHDRRFIERFASEVWELRNGKLVQHVGGLQDYLSAAERCPLRQPQ